MRTVSLWDATRYQPNRVCSNSYHQTGVALPLGRCTSLHLHAGDYRHLFCHSYLCEVQRYTHRPSIRPRDELRTPDWNLPVLCHHIPNDRNAGCGCLFTAEDFPGLGHVFQLCCTAHKDEQDTPHLWAREKVSNSTQVKKKKKKEKVYSAIHHNRH